MQTSTTQHLLLLLLGSHGVHYFASLPLLLVKKFFTPWDKIYVKDYMIFILSVLTRFLVHFLLYSTYSFSPTRLDCLLLNCRTSASYQVNGVDKRICYKHKLLLLFFHGLPSCSVGWNNILITRIVVCIPVINSKLDHSSG